MINLKPITLEINVFLKDDFLKVRRSLLTPMQGIQYTMKKRTTYSNKSNVLMGPYLIVENFSAEYYQYLWGL